MTAEPDDSRPDDKPHTNGHAEGLGRISFTSPHLTDAIEHVRTVNLYEHHYIDRQRRDRFTIVRAVLQAQRDDVDGCVIVYPAEDGDPLPEIVPADVCRRVYVVPEARHGFMTARVGFDRLLAAGDTAILAYQVRWHSTTHTARHHRVLTHPLREYLLRITFDDQVPAACWQFHEPTHGVGRAERPLHLGATGSVHAHLTDVARGLVGIRWQWDQRRSP